MTKKKIIYQLNITKKNRNNLFPSGEIREEVNPLELAKLAEQNGFEEILLLDNLQTEESKETLLELLSELLENVKIPLGVSCEIHSVEDAKRYFDAGANYLVLDSKVMDTPELVDELCLKFGEKSVSVSIFTKRTQEGNFVCIRRGIQQTEKRTETWITQLEQLGVGQIFLTSITNDKSTFDTSIVKYVSHAVSLPVILSLEVDNLNEIDEIFEKTTIKGLFTSNISIVDELVR